MTEEELLAAGVPADVHAAVNAIAAQLDVVVLALADVRALAKANALELIAVRELLETLLGLATGEVTVFHGTVELVDMAGGWPPAEPAP